MASTALKQKIANLKASRIGLSSIKKVRVPIRAETLHNWFTLGKAVIPDWQREEVGKRLGTAEDWIESLVIETSAGIILAYWVGKPVEKDGVLTIEPTIDNPIYIYEGAHRTRWTNRIFKNEVEFLGMNFEELSKVDPDVADIVRNAVIEMTVATSMNNDELVQFAKRDYGRVNLYSAVLKQGELIRTKTDPDRAELEELLKDAMKRNLKPKDRDSDLEDLRAMVHGAAGMVECMDKKKGSLTVTKTLTKDQKERATKVIAAFATAETRIDALFTEKKLKTRVKNRQLDLPLDGTFIHTLMSVSDEQRSQIVDDIVTFHEMFFADATAWSATIKMIKKATKDRSRYGPGETPYPTRWMRIQNLIRPNVLTHTTEVSVPVVRAL